MYGRVTVVNDSVSIGALTNLHGHFKVDGLRPGHYKVSIAHPGYETRTFKMAVGENEMVRINTALRAKTVPMPLLKDISSTEDR